MANTVERFQLVCRLFTHEPPDNGGEPFHFEVPWMVSSRNCAGPQFIVDEAAPNDLHDDAGTRTMEGAIRPLDSRQGGSDTRAP
jgi:hypothetical protein